MVLNRNYFLVVSFLPVSAFVVSMPVFAGESTFGAVDAGSLPSAGFLAGGSQAASDKRIKATTLNFTMFFILVIC